MKTLLLAIVVALLCMQTPQANPVVSETSETKDGVTTVTRTETTDSGTTITKSSSSSSSSGGTSNGGSSWSYEGSTGGGSTGGSTGGSWSYESSGGSSSGGSSSGGSSSGGSSGGSHGGSSSGGSSSGGSSSGGSSSGGSSSGGSSSGGSSSGGSSSGGSSGGSHGGSSSGGSSSGGSSSGGSSSGGSHGGNHDAPCGGNVEIDYELSEADYALLNDKDCEKQLAKLNNDNDHLTAQLKNANSAMAILGSEKSWVLDQLEECRDEYNCMSEDFVTITTEVKVLKKKLSISTDESSKFKTQLIAANSEIQRWKSSSDNFEFQFKKVTEINNKLTITVNTYTTEITNLRTTINEITIKNNNCGSESGEWKRKYETERSKTTQYEQNIKNLQATIADLKSQNSKLTDDLSCCRNDNNENTKEIDTLKTTVNNLKKESSTYSVNWENCKVALKKVTDEFSADELEDHELSLLRGKLEKERDTCLASLKETEENWETEKSRVLTITNSIVVIREECSARYKKYEDDITQLKITFQGNWDKCEDNLKIERQNVVNINIKFTNLKNEYSQISNDLETSIKNANEWKLKNQLCEDVTVTLNESIKKLNINIQEINGRLSSCQSNSERIENDLTTCRSDLNNCNNELGETKGTIKQRDAVIVSLTGEIDQLKADKKKCSGELSSLRCDVNQFLSVIQSNESKAVQALIAIQDLYKGSKNALEDFVGSHNIECESCAAGGPCISVGAAPA